MKILFPTKEPSPPPFLGSHQKMAFIFDVLSHWKTPTFQVANDTHITLLSYLNAYIPSYYKYCLQRISSYFLC